MRWTFYCPFEVCRFLAFVSMMVAAADAFAQGALLFDTKVVNARVWHHQRCEPVTGEEFVAQLYLEQVGPIGLPIHFGENSEAGYVNGGVLVVDSAPPDSLIRVRMRFWETGYDSLELARTAGAWFGQTTMVDIRLGEPGTPAVLVGLETVWGACPAEVRLRMEAGESEPKLFWEMRGFPSFYIAVLQEAENPAGPWEDVETNPPNPVTLPAPVGTKFYRMRLTTSTGF